MLFTSPFFLFIFLPTILAIYYAAPRSLRNITLVFGSIFFYVWGEGSYVQVIILSVIMNYVFGMAVGLSSGERIRRMALYLAIGLNLALLIAFKYDNFIIQNLNVALPLFHLPVLDPLPGRLPAGISFFTFHAMSYIIDVHRRRFPAQTSLTRMALYITLFPQLIAGPIVRYKEIATQLVERSVSVELFASGVRRFIIGLGKKMLIANTLALPADRVFATPAGELSPEVAWFGVLCYTLQLYFDFSGYSDMAIGLARLFGFHLPENFNYPYISTSVREFWRRWHMTLSNWFRDYVYIPLGGNQRGRLRVLFNLWTVFFLCGIWHGASWNFVIWGLYHGAFLVLERLGLGDWLERSWRPVRHIYLLFAIMIGWVFFRADNLDHAISLLRSMFGLSHFVSPVLSLESLCNTEVALALALGIAGSLPVIPKISEWGAKEVADSGAFWPWLRRAAVVGATQAALAVVLILSVMMMAANTYNPFIYFRF
jgi:alginate O-acetyltransferase complex protein AlgI